MNLLNYFQGKRIATSYPNTVKSFFKKNGIEADDTRYFRFG